MRVIDIKMVIRDIPETEPEPKPEYCYYKHIFCKDEKRNCHMCRNYSVRYKGGLDNER